MAVWTVVHSLLVAYLDAAERLVLGVLPARNAIREVSSHRSRCSQFDASARLDGQDDHG
ncbi:MAG: hypothetical protein ACOCR6_01650 [archaeon]